MERVVATQAAFAVSLTNKELMMGYRWRPDPITGEQILMNDAEVAHDNDRAVGAFGILSMLVSAQIALPSETSMLIRCVVGVLSIGGGLLLGGHVLGIMAAFASFVAALFLGFSVGLEEMWIFVIFGAVVNLVFFVLQARPQAAPQPEMNADAGTRRQGFQVFSERAGEIARAHGSSDPSIEKAIRRHKKRNG